ncbi:hypothetical protein LTR78_000369 [Recurvomyces mirabilis]|uniref:Uncharacterized protein n=1 Tax=Recurvomyces mirabilis TaxID=574656 RepID=A0AAE0WX48_9PEZI|nr:hypothetical protein LTR78_000369 [Recurvomyces mirabilis]KAK5162024.1 hypothetical protein LTS14_000370 [Recurvomyces mirabilis]
MPDGSKFDDLGLLALVRSCNSPFKQDWDVEQLIAEVEQNLGTTVVDIPMLYNGSNDYGFHLKLDNRPDVVVRPARGEMNMPKFDGFPLAVQASEVAFEAATYSLLLSQFEIKSSKLLYHRIPKRCEGSGQARSINLVGRRFMVFEQAESQDYVWRSLDQAGECAEIRAALLNFDVLYEFATSWLRERLFEQTPDKLPIGVASTRDFCVGLFTSKIEATIKKIGDMIGWESDRNTVGPRAAAAKISLLKVIPHILPPEDGDKPLIYRLVLEHGDFGTHNMSVKIDSDGTPVVTSLYDWETGCITPALLSDTTISIVSGNLTTADNAVPVVSRVKKGCDGRRACRAC